MLSFSFLVIIEGEDVPEMRLLKASRPRDKPEPREETTEKKRLTGGKEELKKGEEEGA